MSRRICAGLKRSPNLAACASHCCTKLASPTLWTDLAQLFPLAGRQPALDELVQRLINIQSLEAARCMEEGVLTRAQDADVGSVLGWGFPAFRGGTISHIHSLGLASFIQQCDDLAAKFGERFRPAPILLEMAASGQSFYQR